MEASPVSTAPPEIGFAYPSGHQWKTLKATIHEAESVDQLRYYDVTTGAVLWHDNMH